jgi:hypothetical protein
MKKIILILIFIISISNSADSQNYFPLKIGNIFTYHYYYHRIGNGFDSTVNYDYRCTITKDSLINNKRYFWAQYYYPNTNYLLRVDSLTGSLYKYDPTNSCNLYYCEKLIDSLLMPLNGVSNYCSTMQVTSINNVLKWNLSCTEKKFYHVLGIYSPRWTYTRIYNSYFGPVERTEDYLYNPYGYQVITITLKGCVIDGILYGDTTLINIIKISAQVPDKFSLSQNYPNPFNPETKIKFSVPQIKVPSPEGWQTKSDGVGLVRLKVYDPLGREIESLVNEALQPGTYEVTFNGSKYNSGVYFYRLSTDGYRETKRMILLK